MAADNIGDLLAFGVQQGILSGQEAAAIHRSRATAPDLRVARTETGYTSDFSPPMMRRTVTALSNILRTQQRTLPAEDWAALACLRDTLSSCLASGKAYEGSLSTYE